MRTRSLGQCPALLTGPILAVALALTALTMSFVLEEQQEEMLGPTLRETAELVISILADRWAAGDARSLGQGAGDPDDALVYMLLLPACTAVRLLARAAIRPLDAVQAQIAQRGQERLGHLPAEELRAINATLNALMERLGRTIGGEHSIATKAAHTSPSLSPRRWRRSSGSEPRAGRGRGMAPARFA